MNKIVAVWIFAGLFAMSLCSIGQNTNEVASFVYGENLVTWPTNMTFEWDGSSASSALLGFGESTWVGQTITTSNRFYIGDGETTVTITWTNGLDVVVTGTNMTAAAEAFFDFVKEYINEKYEIKEREK